MKKYTFFAMLTLLVLGLGSCKDRNKPYNPSGGTSDGGGTSQSATYIKLLQIKN
jgi:hypothetical protein